MGGGKAKLNRIFWVSWSCSQLLRPWIKELIIESPVSFTDSQHPSFDHLKWSEPEECSVKWEISHSTPVSQSHDISLISEIVCDAELGQDSPLPSPAKTLILGSISFGVSRSLLRTLCPTAFPKREFQWNIPELWYTSHSFSAQVCFLNRHFLLPGSISFQVPNSWFTMNIKGDWSSFALQLTTNALNDLGNCRASAKPPLQKLCHQLCPGEAETPHCGAPGSAQRLLLRALATGDATDEGTEQTLNSQLILLMRQLGSWRKWVWACVNS